MTVGWLLLYALALYAASGILVGLAFVASGVTRILDHPASVSPGARMLLFPAAASPTNGQNSRCAAAFALLMALLLRAPEAQSATNTAIQDLAR